MPPWAQRERERLQEVMLPPFNCMIPRQNTENKGRGQPHQAKVWSVKKKLVKGGLKKRSSTIKYQKSIAKSSSKLWRNSKEAGPIVQ